METKRQKFLPSLRIRIDLDPEGRIGHGKIRLLEAIHTCGSISAAGRTMNMSYRHAWGLIDEITRTFKRDVIVRRVGGEKGGGAELTPFGLTLVARYRKIERSVKSATRKQLLAIQADIGNN
jgi:molybdate transport system regulatory protein